MFVADARSDSIVLCGNRLKTPTRQFYPLGNTQAQAKQQKRQILARQEEAKFGGRERGTSDIGDPTPALSSSASLTDGEGTSLPRRDRRRHWQGGRAAEASGGYLSDSEVVMCDNGSASRWVCCVFVSNPDQARMYPEVHVLDEAVSSS